MEALHDGDLVRQHHLEPNWRITREEGVRYRLQRISATVEGINILCCRSPYVSKEGHCEIFRRDQAYWIKDLGSFNGTFLNGNKLEANVDTELHFGDMIGLGLSHLEDEEYELPVGDASHWIFRFEMVAIGIDDVKSDH